MRRCSSAARGSCSRSGTLPQPVIARVQGHALAAGCQLVAACDLAVAAEVGHLRHARREDRPVLHHADGPAGAGDPGEGGDGDAPHGRADLGRRGAGPGPGQSRGAGREARRGDPRDDRRDPRGSPMGCGSARRRFTRSCRWTSRRPMIGRPRVMTDNALRRDAQEGISAFLAKRPPKWSGRDVEPDGGSRPEMPLLGFAALHDQADDAAPARSRGRGGRGRPRRSWRPSGSRPDRGWVAPILCGPSRRSAALADESASALDGFAIVEAEEADAGPRGRGRGPRWGGPRCSMKGRVATPDLMHAILDPEHGLRSGRSVCQVVLMEIPARLPAVPAGRHRRDGPAEAAQEGRHPPRGRRRRQALGADAPRVAIMAASEKVIDTLPETFDAAELQRRAERGEFPGVRRSRAPSRSTWPTPPRRRQEGDRRRGRRRGRRDDLPRPVLGQPHRQGHHVHRRLPLRRRPPRHDPPRRVHVPGGRRGDAAQLDRPGDRPGRSRGEFSDRFVISRSPPRAVGA